MPSPNCLTVGASYLVVKEFNQLQGMWQRHLPGVIDFGCSPFGDDYSISCRKADYGCIYFVDHEAADPDCLSLRLTSAVRAVPAGWTRGFKRVASSFTAFLDALHFSSSGWLEYLLSTESARFRQFVNEVGLDFRDETDQPVICFAASYGTVEDVEWMYHQGARSPEIVCYAVRNTHDPIGILRFLLGQGEKADFAYVPGKPYAMGYALRNNLPEIVAVLKAYGVPDSPAL